MRLCGVQGCERRYNAHGLCLAHYRRHRKGVEVATPIRERQTLLEAFWSRVNVAGDCWLWTGRPTAQGYGAIHWGGRHITAHRLSVEIHSGPIQDGLQVDHVCRNRLCVRPEHLRVVTDGENKQNLGVYANSSTGVRGVSYYPKRGQVFGLRPARRETALPRVALDARVGRQGSRRVAAGQHASI